jgi:hypothetical protein
MKRKKRRQARNSSAAPMSLEAAVTVSLERADIRHCDDYIDDPTTVGPLRTYLAFARAPAHGQLLPKPHPRLFADHDGQRVRVTMASRLGDVGITTDHARELGYDRRVAVSELSNFSEEP